MFAYSSLIIISLVIGIGRSKSLTSVVKCCDEKSVLNKNFMCQKLFESNNKKIRANTGNQTLSYAHLNITNITHTFCFKNGETGTPADTQGDISHYTCVDVLENGTSVELVCPSQFLAFSDIINKCDSMFTQLKFWGATMVNFATIVYNVPFIIVVIIYSAFPELRTRAYDKAVICYNMCYIAINFQLITLGFYSLCHTPLSDTAYRLFGIGLMFSTQGAVVWVLILCFDMTLVITRFRWAPKSGAERGREEKQKFLIYSAWAWGFSTFLTMIATIVEFTPILSEDSPIRPNFHKFRGANTAVIVYVITGPVIVCLTTTSLFIYTTLKTIAIQKSTAIVNENRKTSVKKKYLLFLKLYIVMDTPWVTSALAAIYDDLWVLKFIKMVQPIVMLILIVPRKRVARAISCCKAKASSKKETEPLTKATSRMTNLQTKENINLPAHC